MFYLHQGKVCVTPVGRTIPEYIKLEDFCTKKYKNNKFFVDICYYIFFVYHKVDALGNKNAFNSYPINDRREIIVDKYGLFEGIKLSSKKKSIEISDLYTMKDRKGNRVINDFIQLYIEMCYTESERTLETFRAKIGHWREKYSNMKNTADEDKEYEAALTLAQKKYKEYETKVILESSNSEEGGEGFPLYLFEIPESQKPMHHRLQYGDLKKVK
jgi:hypothetical protein